MTFKLRCKLQKARCIKQREQQVQRLAHSISRNEASVAEGRGRKGRGSEESKGVTIKRPSLPVGYKKEAGFYFKHNEKPLESLEAEGWQDLMDIWKRNMLPAVWGMN